MAERKIFAYFGICCAGALAMLGLMFGAAYLVSLLPEDTPERLEKLGVIKPAPSYEDSSAPPPEDGESAISGDTDFSEENGGLFVPVSLDLSRRSSGEVTLQNETSYKLDLSKAELPRTEGEIRGTPPTVLVYHTHGTESYSPSGGYGGSYSFRSEDVTENVVAAGEALCDALREYGVFALHDLNMYDKDEIPRAALHNRYPPRQRQKRRTRRGGGRRGGRQTRRADNDSRGHRRKSGKTHGLEDQSRQRGQTVESAVRHIAVACAPDISALGLVQPGYLARRADNRGRFAGEHARRSRRKRAPARPRDGGMLFLI